MDKQIIELNMLSDIDVKGLLIIGNLFSTT